MLLPVLLIAVFPVFSSPFIVGGCIGPKSVLERFLNDKQKSELRKMVHNKFDGTNAEQILEESNRYVFGHITEEQWHSIVPELAEYQAKKHECSVYAQLLPKPLYQQLLKSVLRASEMGASKYDVKRLVDDYVDRLAKNGILPDVMDKAPTMPRVTLPEPEVAAQSYRKFPKVLQGRGNGNGNGNGKNGGKGNVHPTLIGYPEGARRPNDRQSGGKRKVYTGQPVFPIARPTPFDLSEYEYVKRVSGNRRTTHPQTDRENHRTPQNFRRYPPPEHECDYYAGPCATSF
uniref:Uncharacterized protein n=1 Tax=Caenorhabditis japonica TaxID=281687 RepID=A0A8R1HKY1_CAEJA